MSKKHSYKNFDENFEPNPQSKKRKASQTSTEKKVCSICGITSLDGATDLGLPPPVIKEREDFDFDLMCQECFESEQSA